MTAHHLFSGVNKAQERGTHAFSLQVLLSLLPAPPFCAFSRGDLCGLINFQYQDSGAPCCARD